MPLRLSHTRDDAQFFRRNRKLGVAWKAPLEYQGLAALEVVIGRAAGDRYADASYQISGASTASDKKVAVGVALSGVGMREDEIIGYEVAARLQNAAVDHDVPSVPADCAFRASLSHADS